jgi:hypothetical protein
MDAIGLPVPVDSGTPQLGGSNIRMSALLARTTSIASCKRRRSRVPKV